MSRFTVFVDVAGRLSRDVSGGDRTTAAAVAIDSSDVDTLRATLSGLPKWRDSTFHDAEGVVDLLSRRAAAAGLVTLTRSNEEWDAFWEDAKLLQDAIVAQDRAPAGFVKPANVALFALTAHASTLALIRAVAIWPHARIADNQGRELIERSIVCDSDVKGDENIAIFESCWRRGDERQPWARQLGLRFVTRDVIVTTEQDEPLLLLADYLAGIAHSALTPEPGRLPFPVAHEPAKALFERLSAAGKLEMLDGPFRWDYRQFFGDDLMTAVRENAR